MYRKIYTGLEKKREVEGTEEWATVAEARVVFEKGEPRHISLQTNNF